MRLDPDHRRAHFYVLKCAYELLTALVDSGADATLSHRYVNFAFDGLQALDALDTQEEFPLRHLYRGLVNETIDRRSGSEEARLSAIRAYQRFLASPLVVESKDPENAALAAKRLEALLKDAKDR